MAHSGPRQLHPPRCGLPLWSNHHPLTSFGPNLIVSSVGQDDFFLTLWVVLLTPHLSDCKDLNAASAFDALDLNDVISSGASSYSDTDSFPAVGLHHLPAWSTMTMARKAKGNSTSAGAAAAGSVSQGVSPANAISPSGLSDEGPTSLGYSGAKSNNLMDDIWFMSSPDANGMNSPAGAPTGLQRKKKMHFKPNHPSTRFVGGENGGGGGTLCNTDEGEGLELQGSELRNALKAHKSLPQLDRRVSSNYTSRLEDLLAEMGWPRHEGNADDDAEDGDVTIQASASEGIGGTHQSSGGSMLQPSHSHSGMYQNAVSSPYGNHGNGQFAHNATASNPSSSEASSASSALFQRRAVTREGSMPSPCPVAIPRRPQDNSDYALKTDGGAIPTRSESLQRLASAVRLPASSSAPKSASELMSTLSSNMLYSQSMDARHFPHAPVTRQGTAELTQATSSSLPAHQQGHSFDVSQVGHSLPSYGQGPTGAGPSSDSAGSGPGTMNASSSSAGSATDGRPLTASTSSNVTELRTPLTPFTGVGMGNNSQWSAMQPFAYQGAPNSIPELAEPGALGLTLFPQASKPPSNEHYLSSLQNALGLYQDPSTMTTPSAAVNPAAVLDPAAYSHLFGAGIMTQADFTAVAKANRARAGTAMAALDAPRSAPRAMRSSPNLRVTPPLSGRPADVALPASVTTTPIKTPRKFASNRRLNTHTPDPLNSSLGGNMNLPPPSPHSPSKRGRDELSHSASTGNLGSGGGGFEFINYGIQDADELCAAVAPSGSYKVPLKGFGAGGDDDDEEDGNDSDDDRDGRAGTGTGTGSGSGSGGEGRGGAVPSSPRRGRRRAKSSSNRNGPRWEEPPLPPLPGFLEGSHTPLPASSESTAGSGHVVASGGGAAGRQIKRRKSDASMMLAGKHKSASMANLRKRD